MKKFLRTMLVVIVLAVGLIWFFGGDDEDVDDPNHETTKSAEVATTSPSSGGTVISQTDADAKNALKESGAIRDKQVKLKGNGEDTVTILIYMNGSNLETDSGEATTDLTEMVKAGSCDKVNVLVQTMGTKSWSDTYGISSKVSQIYSVDGNGLTLIRNDLGQLDCTKAETLASFIRWGTSYFPADRYMLIFWDHGGGPVYGFGYDDTKEDSDASLSVAEMRDGIAAAGVFFDFIGMDCCIMSSLEVCCALYDYCDYTILSEDFESGLGWHYTPWLKKLYANTSISTEELGKSICDSMVAANEADSESGDKSIMAVIDESMIKVLFTTWTEFAYANEDSLLGTNYSTELNYKNGGRVHPLLETRKDFWDWLDDEDDYDDPDMADYFVTDIMAVAQNIDSAESKALSSALAQTLAYVCTSSGEVGLTGISVTLPYGDSDFYQSMKEVFDRIGMDSTYVNWLKAFTGVDSNTNSYNYDDWYDDWDWDDYDDDYDWSDWDYYDDDDYWDNFYDWDDWDQWDDYDDWDDWDIGDWFSDWDWDWDDYDWDDYDWNSFDWDY